MMGVEITAESIVNPTEDEAKVERALHNIFPSKPVQRVQADNDGHFLLRIRVNGLDSLSTLRSLIRQERIRGAARAILRARTGERGVRIYLNKQAAFVGRVSFCEPTGESANGPISIEILTSDTESVVDYLASSPNQGHMSMGRRER